MPGVDFANYFHRVVLDLEVVDCKNYVEKVVALPHSPDAEEVVEIFASISPALRSLCNCNNDNVHHQTEMKIWDCSSIDSVGNVVIRSDA